MEENTQSQPTTPVPKGSFGGGRTVIIVIIILVVAGAVAYATMNKQSTEQESENEYTEETPSQNIPMDNTGSKAEEAGVKTFNLDGTTFAFSLKEIRVKKGDKVKIVFHNTEGFHDWVLDEFSAKTPQIKAGETAEVEFVADKAGTFEYYCSVGQHRAMGMKGNLIVEE